MPDVQSNGHVAVARQAALDLIKRDIMPIHVPYGTKNPSNRRGWQNERYTLADLSAFDVQVNVGMRLGHIVADDGTVLTNHFVDVDLDCPEAVRAAPYYLPPTAMRWGRASNPNSHWGYRVDALGTERNVEYVDNHYARTNKTHKDAGIVEIRVNGHTLAPGSVNAEGKHPEKIRWEPDGDGFPASISYDVLHSAVKRLYACALIARYWNDGIRHNASLRLAGMLQYGGMPEDDAVAFMESVCAVAGEDASEIANRVNCVHDTYTTAKRDPAAHISGRPQLKNYLPDDVVDTAWRILGLRDGVRQQSQLGDIGPDGLGLTDIGNAERFAAAYEGKILHCDDRDSWYVYRAGKWDIDHDNYVMECAKELVLKWRHYVTDPKTVNTGNATIDQSLKWAREWSRTRNLKAMLDIVKALLPVRPEQFDANPWLLNVLDGTVVLNNHGGHYIRAASSQDLLTKQWNAHYNPDAVHEDIDWYRRTFVPEDDRWEFIEEALGYSLTGLPKRYSFQLYGPSHTGKSMLLQLIRRNFGSYGAALRYESLITDMHGGGGKPRSDLLSLIGARSLTVTEVGDGAIWDVALFKTMTSGGDMYEVRGAYSKRGQQFAFTCSLWTSGNKPYGAQSGDDAAYERVRVIKLEHPMPEHLRDDAREDEITDPDRTGDAFLALALRGFSRLYGEKGGRLIPPDSVREETASVRDKLDRWTDIMASLFEFTGEPDDAVVASEAWEQARMLYEAGERIRSMMKVKGDFTAAMERRGATAYRSRAVFGNRECWRGVKWVGQKPADGEVVL